tara:strand:- start:1471 stop:1641 length:171 start_codon:yes stop_codon:yes gene_type:complete
MIFAFFMFMGICAIGAIITEIKSKEPKPRFNVLESNTGLYNIGVYNRNTLMFGDSD